MSYVVFTRDFYESPYLTFFIEHYLKIGFDKIVILKADDNEYLVPTEYKERVEIHKVKNEGDKLLKLYTHLIKKQEYSWILSVDADEILLLSKKYNNIKDYVNKKLSINQNINIFYFRWANIHITNNQYANVKFDFILEKQHFYKNKHIKSMIKQSELLSLHTSHTPQLNTNNCIYFENNILSENNKLQNITNNSYKEHILVHLHTRSINNLILKCMNTLFMGKLIKNKDEFIEFINNKGYENITNQQLIHRLKQLIGTKVILLFIAINQHEKYTKKNIYNTYNYKYNVIYRELEEKLLNNLLDLNNINKENYNELVKKIELLNI